MIAEAEVRLQCLWLYGELELYVDKTILYYVPLGLNNFKLLPHRWQNHIMHMETKFNVDMSPNWPLGSVFLPI